MPVSKKTLNKTDRENRVLELQRKVHMEAAIQRIALVLSRKLVENNNVTRMQ